MSDFVEKLRAIVGDKGLITDEAGKRPYLTDWRDAYLGKFSKFMPVGFYYRSFYKPKGMWKVWEPIIRKKAGLGALALDYQPEYHDKAFLFVDIAVVGAGPAGLACASVAAGRGHQVTLFDSAAEIGGQFNLAKKIPGKEEFHETLRYFGRQLALTGVDLRLGQRVDAAGLAAGGFDDIVLATVVNPSFLPATESYQNSSTIAFPKGLSGEFHFLVKTDIYNQVFEGFDNPNAPDGEDNNTWASSAIQIVSRPADLVVDTITAPASIIANDSHATFPENNRDFSGTVQAK